MSKKLLLFLLVPAVLIIGGYLFLRISMKSAVEKDKEKTGEVMPAVDTLGGKKVAETDLRALFITRMKQLLKKSSNGLYDVTVGDMQVDVLASSLLLKKVVMKPDAPTRASLTKSGHLPNDIYSISFDELQVDGINLDDAITRKTMDYRLVKLVRPIITINHRRGEKQKVQKEEFSQRFLKEMNKLSIKKQ